MTNNELLLAISEMMDQKLEPIKIDIRELKEDVHILNQKVTSLEQKFGTLEQHNSQLELKINGIQITLENDMNPRLKNIESCYTSTYERYRNGINHLESMQMDINLLKKVVSEHSEKLNHTA